MSQPDISEQLLQWNKIDRYSNWMFNNFRKHLGKRILDIGSGTGTFIEKYLQDSEIVLGTDIFEKQVDFMNERFKKYDKFKCLLFDIMNDDTSDFKKYNFDTITCINVIEHIEDDTLVLKKLADILGDQGVIIILVPAMPFLFSEMDRACGHYRRYKKGRLKENAEKVGLKVIEDKYMNSLGILPYYIKGRFKKNKTFSESLGNVNSKLYNMATAVLEPIEKVIKPPFGISEIIILQK